MPVAFPPLKPISSSMTPASFPVKEFRTVAGNLTERLYGSKGDNLTMQLDYLLPGSQMAQIMAAWNAAASIVTDLTMPPEAFAAFTPAERATIPSYLKWKFAAPLAPAQAGVPGWSRVTVQLRGELS